ncbi:H-NS family nucleoid-associated regulatory protein [Burkholderia sp. Ac-20365]|uniref:H-NS family nucleoid-associated regulatory protein n=1 Tax=Burkholderia sp. Ac-20365 TaxID=2703897 RepID=UPI00197C089A|nr:H-NS family nucleoid-associated regulatory protein [Burkholderia sp. Ac-20365]MBN3767850.1 H-NS histone family protein [Burkholderia sp. Ac-20365]
MATLQKVQAQIAKLQAQAEALAARQSSGVIAKIRDIMEKHGLTTADIDAHIGGAKRRGRKPGVKAAAQTSTSAAKYRDPKSGATWTGHGRAPAWIASAKDRNKYLIEGNAVASGSATTKNETAGNYVRGPQAPKYRDPKTGATWSGRGPAPAWLASAKDRTKYLIAGAAESATESKPEVAKKASTPAKKVVGKKATARAAVAKKSAVKKAGVAAKKEPAKKAASKKAVVRKAAKKVVTQKASISADSGSTVSVTAPEATSDSSNA